MKRLIIAVMLVVIFGGCTNSRNVTIDAQVIEFRALNAQPDTLRYTDFYLEMTTGKPIEQSCASQYPD